METCRICQQECSDDQQFCSNCGYPLTTFPATLGEIPGVQEILSQRERWEKEVWQKYEQSQRQYTELSRNYQQLQQQFQQLQQQVDNYQRLQQQIDQLKQENARLQGQVESYSQSQQQLIEPLREVLQENQRRQSQENSQPDQQIKQKSESQSSSQQQGEVPLESAVGYDYTRLRDLLANQEWKEADEETANAMLKVMGRDNFLIDEDIDNFPCKDLQTIDHLWVKFSGGKFGLSVQKEIYQSLGGTQAFNMDIWNEFGDTVGWREHGEWKHGNELNWKNPTAPSTPRGHLPVAGRWGFFPPFWHERLNIRSERSVLNKSPAVPAWAGTLAQRLVNCNI